jgi:hypothetical protein
MNSARIVPSEAKLRRYGKLSGDTGAHRGNDPLHSVRKFKQGRSSIMFIDRWCGAPKIEIDPGSSESNGARRRLSQTIGVASKKLHLNPSTRFGD